MLGDEDEGGDPERELDGVGAEGPERGVHRCGAEELLADRRFALRRLIEWG